MAGYPGTIAATWQRAGRAGPADDAIGGGAGREQRADRSVHRAQPVVLLRRVARARADQSRQPAHPARSREVRGVRAAVRERRAVRRRRTADEVDLQAILSVLSEEGFVHQADGQWNWTNESYPADAVSLRSVSSDNFVVVDSTNGERVIGETDFTSGPSTLHEKAIYILEGQLFQVERLDFDGRKAYRARGGLRLLHRRDHLHEGHDPGYLRVGTAIQARARAVRAIGASRTADRRIRSRAGVSSPTAKSTSSRASSASRRSSSTRTRTSARASSICPSSRCTPRRTG